MHPINEFENWSMKDSRSSIVELEIYADEIITPRNFNGTTKNWLGIGCLFVPLSKKKNILSNLVNSRCLFKANDNWVWDYSSCPFSSNNGGTCKEQWHQQNMMCEIHHHELKSSRSSNSQKGIAKKWIDFLLQNGRRNRGDIYFNILFIDLDRLQISCFGNEKVHENIYNRFFRTVIEYGLKSFFADKKVIIRKVFHDKGSVEHHTYFPYYNLHKLDLKLNSEIEICDKEVMFVDSDHRSYLMKNDGLLEESHLIQFMDLILGSIAQNMFYLSEDSLKKEIAMLIRPLLEQLLKFPTDLQNRYHYHHKQHVAFFPMHRIEDATYVLTNFSNEESEIYRTNFYTDREMEMPTNRPQQQSLSVWFKQE
jgi:hypothetical protein